MTKIIETMTNILKITNNAGIMIETLTIDSYSYSQLDSYPRTKYDIKLNRVRVQTHYGVINVKKGSK